MLPPLFQIYRRVCDAYDQNYGKFLSPISLDIKWIIDNVRLINPICTLVKEDEDKESNVVF